MQWSLSGNGVILARRTNQFRQLTNIRWRPGVKVLSRLVLRVCHLTPSVADPHQRAKISHRRPFSKNAPKDHYDWQCAKKLHYIFWQYISLFCLHTAGSLFFRSLYQVDFFLNGQNTDCFSLEWKKMRWIRWLKNNTVSASNFFEDALHSLLHSPQSPRSWWALAFSAPFLSLII